MRYLEQIDIYGLEANLFTFGKKKFTSWLGGFLTLLTVALLGAASFMFGQDFWLKVNPKVLSRDIVPDKSELIYPTSQNFTVLFRLEDQFVNLVDDPEQLLVPHFTYVHYKKDENSNWKILADFDSQGSKCSETAATQNENLPQLNLAEFACVDWEDIANQVNKDKQPGEELYRPVLGGTWEEDELGYLGIYLSNSYVDGPGERSLRDFQKSSRFIEEAPKYISIFYRESYFDASDFENPLNTYWKNYFFKVSSKLYRKDRFFLSLTKLDDDIGWIFEDIQSSIAISKSYQEIEMELPRTETLETKAEFFYTFALYFERSQTGLKRSYMKIQELGALLGGFMKVIQIVFVFISGKYAAYKRVMFVRKRLEKKCNLKDNLTKGSTIALAMSNNYLNTSVSALKKEKQVTLNFWQYTLRILARGEKKNEYERISVFEGEMNQKIDMQNIFSLSARVNLLEERLAEKKIK